MHSYVFKRLTKSLDCTTYRSSDQMNRDLCKWIVCYQNELEAEEKTFNGVVFSFKMILPVLIDRNKKNPSHQDTMELSTTVIQLNVADRMDCHPCKKQSDIHSQKEVSRDHHISFLCMY